MKIVIITASFLAAAVFTRAGQILSPTAAGIMIGLQPANNTFRGIESNFTIPEMLIAGTLNSSDFPTNQVNISVGLGMDDNFRFSNPNGSLIQAGIRMILTQAKVGVPLYLAWYRWLPYFDVVVESLELDMEEGHKIMVKVQARESINGSFVGSVFLKNARSGKKISHEHALAGQHNPLIGSYADLIVEGADNIANFIRVKFDIGEIITPGPFDITELLAGSDILDIIDSKNTTITRTTIDSNEASVQVEFLGHAFKEGNLTDALNRPKASGFPGQGNASPGSAGPGSAGPGRV